MKAHSHGRKNQPISITRKDYRSRKPSENNIKSDIMCKHPAVEVIIEFI